MSLVVVGVSHKTAPIELRERLVIPVHRLAPALDQLKSSPLLKEIVVLSTCNRVEVYGHATSELAHVYKFIAQFFSNLYETPTFEKNLYQHEGTHAIEHLFRVASGLDSLVVGETEVLGQVKSSYLFAQSHGVTGKITNVLFQRALFVGKSVRNKTAISEGSSSVGSIAAQLAERIFGHLDQKHVLLLGAGEMAEVTARHLLSQKATQLTILNRTLSKAEELAALLNGKAGSIDQLENELLTADIVICSTSSEKPLISKLMVAPLMETRRMKALYFIDIAVPRNVDPKVHDIDNVYVYNIDDLTSLVQENLEGRKKEVSAAESLVKQMADEFHAWVEAALNGENRPLKHHV